MRKVFFALAAMWSFAGLYAVAESLLPSKGYGVCVYSTQEALQRKLVSFPVDNPSDVSDVMDLSAYNIVAATCHDNVYYLIHSDDGILPSKFIKLNLDTRQSEVVKTYDWKHDYAGNIIFSDMAFDPSSDCIYVGGYNLNDGDVEEGEATAPYGIFTFDYHTGEATLVGEQDECIFVSLMVDNEGSLLGVDNMGTLWEISKWNGLPNYDLVDLGRVPVGLQSMSYDFGKDVSYWASYSSDNSGEGVSSLIKVTRTPDWEYVKEEIGPVGTDCEIVGLYIDSNPLPADAPSVVESLSVARGDRGAMTATLSWVNPSVTIGGTPLSEIQLNIYRDGTLVNTIAGDGGNQSWTDTEMEAGYHLYSVAAVNVATSSEGRQTFAPETWIGEDVPGAPTVKAVKNGNNAINVSWSAPVEGLHGGWFDADNVDFTVIRQPDSKTLLEKTSMTSFADEGLSEMHAYYYEVVASSAAGAGGTGKSEPVVAGAPHAVPFMADFNDADQARQWTSFNNDGDEYGWTLYTSGWGGTYDAFFRYNPENKLDPESPADDWLISPPVQLEQGRLYVVRYDVRLLGSLFPANSTFAMGSESSPESMTNILRSVDGEVNDIQWETISVPFTVEESGPLSFGYQVRNAVPVQFYKFAVVEVPAVDMSVGKMVGDKIVNKGSASIFKIEVANNGFYPVENFTVELVGEDEEVLAAQDYDRVVDPQASVQLDFVWTPAIEGAVTITPRVTVAGDTDNSNDLGEPFGVTVFGEGKMVNVTDGKTATGYAPFYGQYLHSAVQTIYPAEMIAEAAGGDITAIVYYTYSMMGGGASGVVDFDVALACVEKEDFSDNTMIGEQALTQVYNGELRLDPSSQTVAIIFDTPFHYEGGNLCVFTRHDSEKTLSAFFQAAYSTSDPLFHTALYRGDQRFDFTQSPSGCYRDLPNMSLLVKDKSGVETTFAVGATNIVSYSRDSGIVRVNDGCDICRVYSASGVLLGEYRGVGEFSVAGLPDGVLLLEAVSSSGRQVMKIVK